MNRKKSQLEAHLWMLGLGERTEAFRNKLLPNSFIHLLLPIVLLQYVILILLLILIMIIKKKQSKKFVLLRANAFGHQNFI